MKKIISLMIVFCMVFNVSWAIAEEDLQDKLVIHVAVTGSDMNPGTEEKPLATLTGARNKIREIKKRNKPIDVIFHKGEYLIKDTVFLINRIAVIRKHRLHISRRATERCFSAPE